MAEFDTWEPVRRQPDAVSSVSATQPVHHAWRAGTGGHSTRARSSPPGSLQFTGTWRKTSHVVASGNFRFSGRAGDFLDWFQARRVLAPGSTCTVHQKAKLVGNVSAESSRLALPRNDKTKQPGRRLNRRRRSAFRSATDVPQPEIAPTGSHVHPRNERVFGRSRRSRPEFDCS